jgi:hypothetical protein
MLVRLTTKLIEVGLFNYCVMKLFKSTTTLIFLLPFFGFSQYDESRVNELINKGTESELVMESSVMIQEGYLYQAG